MVYDHSKNVSTLTSAGVLNPTVLKRFTKVWNAEVHLKVALKFYRELSEKIQIPFFSELPLLRLINNIEEQNNWIVACDRKEMSPFLYPKIIKCNLQYIKAPYGFGKVLGTGRIDTLTLINGYKDYLIKNNQLIKESFDHQLLIEKDHKVSYKDISAKIIVFSEGPSVINNLLFPKNLLIGNKGEYLIIKAPELKLKVMIKASIFIIPLVNDLYKVGATYSHNDYTKKTTIKAREEIISKLSKIIQCPFEIVDQIAGIRPTTKDRRPLIGSLPENVNKYFFNGLGTRGILAAPTFAHHLFQYIENGKELPLEIDIKRFYK